MNIKKTILAMSLATITLAPLSVHAEEVKTINMYRLYNPNSGEHFYTSSKDERNQLFHVGWKYEGIGWVAPETSNTPVYRLYNKNAGDHHYTTSADEKNYLVALGWKYEGTGWYSADDSAYPLYRQYNPNALAGSHNYTLSKSENDKLARIGWREEGVAWYAVTADTPEDTDPPVNPTAPSDPSDGSFSTPLAMDATVYVTRYGGAYHRANCPTIQGKQTTPMTKAEAIAKHKDECGVCHA